MVPCNHVFKDSVSSTHYICHIVVLSMVWSSLSDLEVLQLLVINPYTVEVKKPQKLQIKISYNIITSLHA